MLTRIERALHFAIFIMGFTALATQVVLLRETMSVFQGNELVLGIILSNWMLLTGAGAFLGRWLGNARNLVRWIAPTQLFIAVLPPLTIAGIYLVSKLSADTGIMFSPGQTWLISLLMLIPFCLLSGVLFTMFSIALTNIKSRFSIGKVYGIESLGSIGGGLAFTLLVVPVLPAFQSLYILFWLNISSVLLLSAVRKDRWLTVTAVAIAILALPLMGLYDLDKAITGMQYPGQEIIHSQETPYGKIVVTRMDGQLNFYENGQLYFSSDQVQKNEETIHFALAQHNDPEKVLLISGGISGTLKELQKYGNIQVDYLEINPAWIDIGKTYTDALSTGNTNAIAMDARKFIRTCGQNYQVVIVDAPAPATAQVNRYYTLEFIREVRKVLDDQGVFSIHLPSSANYMSRELIRSHSSLFNTLGSVFKNVMVIPGVNDYFIASDRNLNFDVLGALLVKGINNTYVNAYYYVPELTQMRSRKILESMDPEEGLNRDFRPKSYQIQLAYWLSHFKGNFWYLGIWLVLLSSFVFLSSRNVNKALFISGFTGASLTFILIISFQVLYGYVYQMTGLIITMFMGGLALGSLVIPWILDPGRKLYLIFQLIIAASLLIAPSIIYLLSFAAVPELLTLVTINLLSLAVGLLIGFQFNQASFLQGSATARAASSAYAVDLAGSTAGSLATALLLVPVLGILLTCVIIAGLNFFVAPGIAGKQIKA